jgi:hypothetical protein
VRKGPQDTPEDLHRVAERRRGVKHLQEVVTILQIQPGDGEVNHIAFRHLNRPPASRHGHVVAAHRALVAEGTGALTIVVRNVGAVLRPSRKAGIDLEGVPASG